MTTKHSSFAMIGAILIASTFLASCKKDEGPKDLNVVSIMAGTIDLNGAVSPTNVPVNPSITIEFTTRVNPTTATSANITLVQDYDNANVPLTITVDGNTLTITPTSNLGGGTLHRLSISSGLLSVEDQPLTELSRTFTTVGTFLPAGIVARWTFEDSANDVVGPYDPAPTGVVGITYSASKSAALGKAANFNGTTSIIEVPNGDVLMNASNFTLSFWVKATSAGQVDGGGNPKGHFVMGLGAFFGFQYEIFGGYDGAKFAIRYGLADGSTASEDMWFPSLATDASTGGWQGWDFAKSLTVEQMQAKLKDNWYQVTYTYNQATRTGTLYYDGEKMKSFSFNLWPEGDAKRTVTGMKYGGTAPDVVNELAFGFIQSRAGTMWDAEPWGGYDQATANHFRGQLDDIKVYHKVLTPAEILLMYNSEK